PDANYFTSGDTLIDSTTMVGFFNAIGKLADGATATRNTENAYGLYDASGNVAEWTQDFLTHDDPTMRATRGGSWRDASGSASLTTTGRAALSPGARNAWTGFRVVRGTGHLATITVRDHIAGVRAVQHVILDLREPLTVTPIERYERSGVYCSTFAGRSFAFTIANRSESEMPWSVSAASAGDWLKVEGPTPGVQSGMVPPGPAGTVAITATTTAKADKLAPGEHEAAVTFRNSRTGRSASREVRLIVNQPVEVIADNDNPPAEFAGVWSGPFETLPPLRYWFGRAIEAYADCPPRYDVRVVEDWLTVKPVDPNGVLAGPLPTQAILFPFDVTVNTKANALGVGDHWGRVRFSYVDPDVATPPTPIEKTVRLTVIDPIRIEEADTPWEICCEISPGAWPSRSLTITSLHGSFAVPVSVTTDVDWIDVDAESFILLPGGTQTVTATLNDNALLRHGVYTGTIRITDLITQHQQTRSVRLTIVETFTVSPETDFQAAGRVGGLIAPASLVYRLTNVESEENSALEWHVDSDQPWVRINGGASATGVLADGASVDVTISIDAATVPALSPGQSDATFEATLTLDSVSDGETVTRRVYVTRVIPKLDLDEVTVPATARQPNGPAYTFHLGRFDVTNAEFVTFLND
ncbi:MAG: SUMF1/EgtB/PvdO family nonheme iron enzyme, partial [Phycisphaerales bacterium]|nr:SUMF1/EgtB/PvdO family nonheme iron enzyme [Phycisphaerales bacterium]